MKSTAVIDAFSALAQMHRLAAFRLLVQAGDQGTSAGALTEALGVPSSSLSVHLAELTRAGLVRQERRSRALIRSADYPAMNALVGYLMKNCCGGADCSSSICEAAPAQGAA